MRGREPGGAFAASPPPARGAAAHGYARDGSAGDDGRRAWRRVSRRARRRRGMFSRDADLARWQSPAGRSSSPRSRSPAGLPYIIDPRAHEVPMHECAAQHMRCRPRSCVLKDPLATTTASLGESWLCRSQHVSPGKTVGPPHISNARVHPGWMHRLSQCDGSRFGRRAPGWGPGPPRLPRPSRMSEPLRGLGCALAGGV